MKRFTLYFISALIGILLVSCENTDYKNVIPMNSNFVISLDMKSMFNNIDIPDETFNSFSSLLSLFFTGSDSDKFMAMLKGDENTGIDFASPFYFFISPEIDLGLTFKVDDDDDLDDFFDMLKRSNIAKKPVEQDDIKWSTLFDDINVAYNDKTLTLLVAKNSAQSKKELKKLFDNTEDDSFISSAKYEKMESVDGPLVCFYNCAFLNRTNHAENVNDFFASFLPEGVRVVDANVINEWVFNNGQMDVNMELFSTNEKSQKLLEKENKKYETIDGDFINAPNDFLAWIGAGVKGEDFLKRLKAFDEINGYILKLDRAIDIQKIIKSIDGDLAVVIPGLSDKDVEFVMTAKTSNTDFLKDVDYWNETMKDYGIKMSENSKNNFTLSLGKESDGMELNWGVDGDNVYFASKNSFFKSAFSEKSDKLESVRKSITNSIFYAYLNNDGFEKNFSNMLHLKDEGNEQLSNIDSYIFQAKDFCHYTFSICMKDKSKNFIQQMLDVLKDMTSGAGMNR